MKESFHLCDLIAEAEIDAPSSAHVQVQPMEVGGVEELALFQHPNSRVRFALPAGIRGGKLRVGLGIKTVAWEHMSGAVTFRVGIEVGGRVRWRLKRRIDPRTRSAHRAWLRAEVAVSERATAIVLETRSGKGGSEHAWAGWADPVVEVVVDRDTQPRLDPAPSVASPAGSRFRPNILLITSDACRADAFGCYGNVEARTPNLDALAAEGLVFQGARTTCALTVGSYSSLLTGLDAPNHGSVTEWMPFPIERASLPTALAGSGYHTIFVPSDREIAAPEKQFASAFAGHAECVGNPNQDGALTTRSALRELASATDRPWFCWVAYFDTHPPYRLAPQWLEAFYDGDPTSPERAWRPDLVATLHGVESVVELGTARSLLRDGRVGGECYIRLRDTVRGLRREIPCRPDLADLLPQLPARARRGQSLEDFTNWLGTQVAELAQGSISEGLLTWLDELLVCLEAVDRETIGMAREVVDFRFLLAQGRAALAYFDDQVGILVNRLRDEGIYDDTTIVFCSPHGEVFGEQGDYFDHLSLAEGVLRVPLVVKPGRGFTEVSRGSIDGLFELTDLFPTLLDGHGLVPPPTDGESMIPDLTRGHALRPRDSFAIDASAVRATVMRAPYKLVKARGWTTFEGCPVAPGTTRLYRVNSEGEQAVDGTSAEHHAVSRALEASLDAWLGTFSLEPLPG